VVGLIAGIICLLLIFAIIVWVITVIARGGLIAGVQQVEDEESTSFGRAWRVGANRFWTLFGIGVLATLPFIILLVMGIIALVVTMVGVGVSDISEGPRVAGILGTVFCCGGGFCCIMIALGLVLGQIRIYAERAAILEGLGWIDAFVRGWDVLKKNLVPTIILWLIFFAIGLVLAGIIFGAMLVLFLPFVAVVANVDPGLWTIAPICCGGLVGIIVAAVISAIIETFTSATWTLAYRELTAPPVDDEIEAETPEPEPAAA
jgi:hypothetical protein